uniref:Uncharacterized protein n=1 Tax=Rhizophora mucronata TaxID=61149 RepID=A0A2P2QSR2_RHIMU
MITEFGQINPSYKHLSWL